MAKGRPAATDKLRQKREKLEAELAVLRDQERTAAERCHAIAGRAVLDHAAKHAGFREELTRALDAELTKRNERRLFGLPALLARTGTSQAAATAATEVTATEKGESTS